MNGVLNYLKSNRKWLVRDISVWGNADSCPALFLFTEDDSPKRVVFAYNRLGGKNQVINFGDLVDINGNNLPDEIINPVVVVIPRSRAHCFVVDAPSGKSFSIAYASGTAPEYSEPGLVDLLIMEMDLP